MQSRQWRDVGLYNWVGIAVIGVLFCFLFRSEIEAIVPQWLTDLSWSHGLLIPLFSLYFINEYRGRILSLEHVSDPATSLLRGRKPKRLLPGQTRPNYLGLVFIVLWIAFYFFNIVSPSGYAYFRYISMIGVLGSVVLFLGGWRLVSYTWLPVAFLVFAVPLPRRYYVGLTMPMRKLAAAIAAELLSLVNGMEATASGVVIDMVYKGERLEPALNVADACSGMRLLMAFMALGVAMAWLHERPVWQRLVLVATTIPIAVFCNIVRVTVTGFIYVFIHPKYTHGIYHDMLGMAMLPLAFGLYGLLAWFMSNLFIEEGGTRTEGVVIRKRSGTR
ncbi:MAG: exosortase/archaeosortase family protein [Phycisphaerales bacterium]|nr:MAG: exosortase/archaeosortase family protein [Phycisphaerales bacterium]